MKPAPENFDDVVVEDFEPSNEPSNEPVKAPSYGNATTEGNYTPPVWVVRAGAGEKSPNGRVQG